MTQTLLTFQGKKKEAKITYGAIEGRYDQSPFMSFLPRHQEGVEPKPTPADVIISIPTFSTKYFVARTCSTVCTYKNTHRYRIPMPMVHSVHLFLNFISLWSSSYLFLYLSTTSYHPTRSLFCSLILPLIAIKKALAQML